MGFPRQEHWNGLPFPSPRDLPNSGIELEYLVLIPPQVVATSGNPFVYAANSS